MMFILLAEKRMSAILQFHDVAYIIYISPDVWSYVPELRYPVSKNSRTGIVGQVASDHLPQCCTTESFSLN